MTLVIIIKMGELEWSFQVKYMGIIQAQNIQWPHFLKRDEATLHGSLGELYLKSEKKI